MERPTLVDLRVAGATAPALAGGGAALLLSMVPGRLALTDLSQSWDDVPVAAMKPTMRRWMTGLPFAAGATGVFPGHETASACTSWTEAREGIVRLPMQPHLSHRDMALQPTIA